MISYLFEITRDRKGRRDSRLFDVPQVSQHDQRVSGAPSTRRDTAPD